MTPEAPDFKAVAGETTDQKRDRLAAKRKFQQEKNDARRDELEAQAKARLAERMKVMPSVLFELMLLAAEYNVEARVCTKDPQSRYSGEENPGVQFRLDDRDPTYLSVLADEWEVEQVRQHFTDLQAARVEAARQTALRASAREKLLNVLTDDERNALGL